LLIRAIADLGLAIIDVVYHDLADRDEDVIDQVEAGFEAQGRRLLQLLAAVHLFELLVFDVPVDCSGRLLAHRTRLTWAYIRHLFVDKGARLVGKHSCIVALDRETGEAASEGLLIEANQESQQADFSGAQVDVCLSNHQVRVGWCLVVGITSSNREHLEHKREDNPCREYYHVGD